MTRTVVAWCLNLHADLELADPGAFRPSPRLIRRVQDQGRRFLELANLGAPAGLRHVEIGSPRVAPGVEAPRSEAPIVAAPIVEAPIVEAWCPTPSALAAWSAAGLRAPPHPPLAVLRAVNHRAFGSAIAELATSELPGAAFVRSMSDLESCLAAARPPTGWLLKRPFGFSGRGRKRVRGSLDPAARRWAEASMSGYGEGVRVEPWVDIEAEFALHGVLDAAGGVTTGEPTRQRCDDDGAWRGSEPAGDALASWEREALHAALAVVASALTTAGYFGPFAIDAFRWRDERGGVHFRPVGEVNARHTMGFFVGFAGRQHEWIARRAR